MPKDNAPFFGVPDGKFNVENPDGVFRGSPDNHSLYDAPELPVPVIPGDYEKNYNVNKQ